MNFDNYKFHPSSLGLVMTDSRTKEPIGETAKAHLLQCWIEETYGRRKDISNKYIEKGLAQEEESITLYSLVTKKFHKKNTETIDNDFFVGTPDLFDGESIRNAELILDIKTSWDIFTFFATLQKPLNKVYYWQLQAYMDLTGASSAKLVYCLVNTPENLILDEKRKLMWAMGVIDPDNNPEYLSKCLQIEKNMTFDDIDKKDRYISFEVKRNDEDIERAHKRVIESREYLNLFTQSRNK